ncbi:carboxymuconolactone decarboxylase family protein [Chitinophaga ginsengisegetis]|uniref:carboxymuconolactone decarboxylase family protein n=1 Tax=Chitinophaga ginsengisegetis TaxID=393003 RepID=UPI000DBAD50E|nr:carboxymuconolactone decarboxylase family protein [Chitinophaga ginsengisegetis]MDR6567383.1 AhpD family alkylhydroperoxidase [Chitinophaga ginsengisegetis]MDR6647114.1 AhpD family alkylhydroperoxidase [Chitinophaga ginsengisegetis]MDR6653463.1 AhpD family alkylhydroperoxidase [Chitinophaga ginsengisegetis]
MTTRFLMNETEPGAYAAMLGLEKYLATTGIAPLHHELIRIRASQINGCAFCVNKHSIDALNLGETTQRLLLLPVWRESPQFTEEERIILAMTEEITLISEKGLTDETYEKALATFGLNGTAQLIMAVNIINAWDRIGITTRRIPGQ